jgi:hypothetical protein
MLGICEEKYGGNKDLVEQLMMMESMIDMSWWNNWWSSNTAQLFKKLYDGWKKATQNATSYEEVLRIWKGAKEVFNLIVNWRSHSHTDLESCKHAAKIFYKTVYHIGIYHYRQTPAYYCQTDDNCAEKIGRPLPGSR